MHHYRALPHLLLFFTLLSVLSACDNAVKSRAQEIVKSPEMMDHATTDDIRLSLDFAKEHNGKFEDSIQLFMFDAVENYYVNNDFASSWCSGEKWHPIADSMYRFVANAARYGLFPEDYHARQLNEIRKQLDGDSLKRMNAHLWSNADMLLTDGFMKAVRDLKLGRLLPDSVLKKKDSALIASGFYENAIKNLLKKKTVAGILNSVEPKHRGYTGLKECISDFLDSMDHRVYTYLTYPYKKGDPADSLKFIKNLQKRLTESNCLGISDKLPDTIQLKTAIRKFQQMKGLKQDGLIGETLVKAMNLTDLERFKRIAITLDRYKSLPDSMPERYIWVNLPGYYLQVWDTDTLAMDSKVICGKPSTPTPFLQSKITDMVTYPTWTVPTSIIAKQYLPRLKTNPGYLSKLGLKLVNGKGETVDPNNVNWSKYSKGIPFNVVQGSGDNNALGVMKFNFDNPYAVYLHDTNQRYLFKNTSRALSHGCVRVQEWLRLANYIARNDSLRLKPGETLKYNADSIANWLQAKLRKKIDVRSEIPLFIGYYSCEAVNGHLKFYDDIYGEDRLMREKYFTNK